MHLDVVSDRISDCFFKIEQNQTESQTLILILIYFFISIVRCD